MICRRFPKIGCFFWRKNSQLSSILKEADIKKIFLQRAKQRTESENQKENSNLQKDLVGIFPSKNGLLFETNSGKNSTVLILLTHLSTRILLEELGTCTYQRKQYSDEPWILLTHRASHLRAHPNEISFPGGRIESHETIEQGVLREAEEEIGLDKTKVKILGTLRPMLTSRSNRQKICTPCVGILSDSEHVLELQPHIGEVQSIFLAPMSELLLSIRYTTFRSTNSLNYTLPVFFTANFCTVSRHQSAFTVPKGRSYRIWGLTAAILHEALCTILNDEQQKNFNL